jgi:hypothetical protein
MHFTLVVDDAPSGYSLFDKDAGSQRLVSRKSSQTGEQEKRKKVAQAGRGFAATRS